MNNNFIVIFIFSLSLSVFDINKGLDPFTGCQGLVVPFPASPVIQV